MSSLNKNKEECEIAEFYANSLTVHTDPFGSTTKVPNSPITVDSRLLLSRQLILRKMRKEMTFWVGFSIAALSAVFGALALIRLGW